MPFSGIAPGSKLERDIDKCVAAIRTDDPGMEKGQAIAICRSRLEKQMGEENTKDTLSETTSAETESSVDVTLTDKAGHLVRRVRDDDEHEKRGDGFEETEGFVNLGATSFAELDQIEAAREAANQIRRRAGQFNGLIDNIMMDPDVEDKGAAMTTVADEFGVLAGEAMERKEKWQPLTDIVANAIAPLVDKQGPAMKTEGGIKFPREDFAFTPSGNVSTWKLRLAEGKPGNITRSQLGAAAAAFSPGGFRGQKVQIPSGDVAAVKGKIRAAYRKIGVKDEDIPPSVRKELEVKEGFTVFKQKDGSYRWLATYSNKFRDVDNPPEIISEASHMRFTKMVNDGDFPYPEVKVWHIDGSRWGQADFVAYDDRGFSIASGTVDKGREWIAESLMAFEGDLLTSHGMPPASIVRDPDDHSIIIRHQTTEISPLPASAAANKFTGFNILGDEVKEMALSDKDEAKLTALNINPERLDADTESKAKDTEELEFKENDPPDTPKETGQDDYVARDEMIDLVKSVGETQKQIVELIGNLVDRVQTLETNKLAIDKETLEHTPAASLTDIHKSVIGSPETKVDGRSSLAKSGP
ncbi:hypothetical protein LCGC14_1649030, partial [marine sediment metagenome]